jgi:hypothetical protein
MGVPQPQLASPKPKSSPAESLAQSFALNTPTMPQQQSLSKTGFHLDLNKAMPDLLNDMLPSYYFLEPTTTASLNPDSFLSTTSDVINTALVPGQNPSTGFEMPLSWDQFDDVMRDFQMDIEQSSGPSSMGNMMGVL